MTFRKWIAFPLLIIAIGLAQACKKGSSPAPIPVNAPFVRGVDLSFTPEIRSYGTLFKYNNVAGNILDLFKDHGVNTVRLRLWVNPSTSHSDLKEVLQFGAEIKNKGLSLLLDIHYSDTWADPGTQTKPAGWQSLMSAQLIDSVYRYTKRVVKTLSDGGAKPTIVQIGNETNSGFLWNDGKVGGSFDSNWPQYAALVKQAIQAVREVDPQIKCMIHYAGYDGANSFFGHLQGENIGYDYMGLSYYPIWHGKDLDQLSQNLLSLVNTYNKPLIVVETAYPFTLGWNDYTNNTVGQTDQLISAYPATLDGQSNFIAALIKRVRSLPNNQGLGICYWAPDWVAFKGATAKDGSAAENQALFDFNNNAVPALDSLGKAK